MDDTLFKKSISKALGGGLSGSFAMVTQVTSLMWLRTSINYQYVNGTNFKTSLKLLLKEGGVFRLYRGYPLALTMGPLSRFGDTATNLGVMEYTKDSNIPLSIKTGISSVFAGFWRICLMPIDSVKTNYQVNGEIKSLKLNVRKNGLIHLFNGTSAAFSTTLVGHYPWFFTYNYINELIPENDKDSKVEKLLKRASCGLGASIVSDTSSNSLKIVKTIKQTDRNSMSYLQIIKSLYKTDGYKWIFRGLKTKIMVNGLNSIVFSISWKYFQEKINYKL